MLLLLYKAVQVYGSAMWALRCFFAPPRVRGDSSAARFLRTPLLKNTPGMRSSASLAEYTSRRLGSSRRALLLRVTEACEKCSLLGLVSRGMLLQLLDGRAGRPGRARRGCGNVHRGHSHLRFFHLLDNFAGVISQV